MISRSKKLAAIYNFGAMVGHNPWYALLIGFLAGQVDRVHFLEDLSGAEIAIRLSARTRTVWPGEPFKATVRGITMPNTFTLIRSIDEENTPICVSFEFDHMEDAPWYQEVLLPNVSFIKDETQAATERSEALWREMDRTLDIYRECKALLKDADPARQKELQYYIQIAEAEMKRLSQQLEELNEKMKRIAKAEE